MLRKIFIVVSVLATTFLALEGFSATEKKPHKKPHASHKYHTKKVSAPAVTSAPAPAPESAPAPATRSGGWFDKFEVTWKRGLTFISKDQKYALKFRILLQPRYEFQSYNTALEGKDDQNTFRMRRLLLSWEGNGFTRNLEYKVQVNAVAQEWKDFLEDAYINYRFKDLLQVEFGQYKVPYIRQQINSSGRLQFTERSLASEEFRWTATDASTTTTCTLPGGGTVSGTGISACGGGATKTSTTTYSERKFHYDTGLMIQGQAFDRRLEYYASVTNGSGPNRLNVNNEFLYLGRTVWNILGQYGYAEADVDYLDQPALFIGGSGGFNSQDNTQTKIAQAGGEIGFKYKGASLQGEYFYRHKNPLAGPTTGDHGYYVQTGYTVIPKHLELAGRVSEVFLAGPKNNKSEYTAGINYYVFGHDLKLQGNYSYLPTQYAAGTANDHRVIVQVQTWF